MPRLPSSSSLVQGLHEAGAGIGPALNEALALAMLCPIASGDDAARRLSYLASGAWHIDPCSRVHGKPLLHALVDAHDSQEEFLVGAIDALSKKGFTLLVRADGKSLFEACVVKRLWKVAAHIEKSLSGHAASPLITLRAEAMEKLEDCVGIFASKAQSQANDAMQSLLGSYGGAVSPTLRAFSSMKVFAGRPSFRGKGPPRLSYASPQSGSMLPVILGAAQALCEHFPRDGAALALTGFTEIAHRRPGAPSQPAEIRHTHSLVSKMLTRIPLARKEPRGVRCLSGLSQLVEERPVLDPQLRHSAVLLGSLAWLSAHSSKVPALTPEASEAWLDCLGTTMEHAILVFSLDRLHAASLRQSLATLFPSPATWLPTPQGEPAPIRSLSSKKQWILFVLSHLSNQEGASPITPPNTAMPTIIRHYLSMLMPAALSPILSAVLSRQDLLPDHLTSSHPSRSRL